MRRSLLHRELRIEVIGQDFYQRELLAIAGPKTEDGVSVWKQASLVPDAAPKDGQPAFVVQIGGRTVAYLSRAQAAALQSYLERVGHPQALLGGVRCRIMVAGSVAAVREDLDWLSMCRTS